MSYTEAPRYWRTQLERYRLVGEQCANCEEKIFPPRDVCPCCGKDAKTPYEFSGKGEVYSYTTVYDAPAGFEEFTPYVVALVKLDEGPLITAQLTDIGNTTIDIGTPVEMVTRKLKESGGDSGIIVYGYKFRPFIGQSGSTPQKEGVPVPDSAATSDNKG